MKAFCLQDSTSGFDSSDDEPSSGYQTSHIMSPQNSPVKSATSFKVNNMKVVLHCQDLYRNHLLICPLQAQLAITHSSQEPQKHIGSFDINEMKYYAQGHFYQVITFISVVFSFQYFFITDNKQVQHTNERSEAQ